MSETEHNVGKLIPVNIHECIEKTAKIILETNGQEKSKYYDTYREDLEDWGYGRFLVTDSKIYEIRNEEIDPCDDIRRASRNNDGTINYEVKYYNGGCGLGEAIEEALDNLKEAT